MRGFVLLKEHGILPGAICVLTRISLRYPEEIFTFFFDNGFRDIAFNVEEVENFNTQSSLMLHRGSAKAKIIQES
jgi:uncharacterized protein